MGQQTSKAVVGAAQKAGKSNNRVTQAAKLPPFFNQNQSTSERTEPLEEPSFEPAQKPLAGPPLSSQRQTQQRPPSTQESMPEMPEDMVQFLKDVGPLKDPSNNKAQPQRKKKLPRHSDPRRTVEAMPLAKNIPGFDTNRTSSFSYKQDDEEWGLDVNDFYDLLEGSNDFKDVAPVEVHELLEQTKNSIALPVLLRDTDDSYVGAWADQADSLVQFEKLSRTDPSRVQLVLQDLADQRRQAGVDE